MSAESRAIVVPWSALPRWDVKAARAAAFKLAHPSFLPLATFAAEATELVHPAREPDKDWPVYGVSNKAGVFFSHTQPGKDFNASYKRIQKDWYFHNPTRANVGSLGRVPDVPEDALTSPEYQVWRITSGLLPEFLDLLLKTAFFNQQIDWHRVGAVKERLFVQNLLAIPVPAFTEDQQAVFVRRARMAEQHAAKLEREAAHLRSAADAEVLRLLGIQIEARANRERAFSMAWSDLHRWGVAWAAQVRHGVDIRKSAFPVVELGSLNPRLQYGSSVKANTDGIGAPMVRMGNIVDGQLVLDDLKHVVLPENDRAALRLVDGDILVNRTNSKELVGKCAVFHADGEYVFASYIIRVQVRDPKELIPDYAAIILNSPLGRQQIDATSRQIIGQANINSEELRSLMLPLPPHAIQLKCVSIVQKAEREAERLRREARRVRAEAIEKLDDTVRSGEDIG
jgi:type I restriction enzyme S subunit